MGSLEKVAEISKRCSWGDKRKKRKHYYTFPALDPRDLGQWDVLFRQDRVSNTNGRPWATSTLAYLVPEVLQAPSAVYVGIRDSEFANDCWLCYVGNLNRAFRPSHAIGDIPQGCEECLPGKDEVFTVYLTHERILYSWRWEKKDPSDNMAPNDASNRFVERIYP